MTAQPAKIGKLSADCHFPDFSKLAGSCAFSPAVELMGKRWRLVLHSQTGFKSPEGYMGCFLQCLSKGTTTVSFRLSLRSQRDDKPFCYHDTRYTFERAEPLPNHSSSTDGDYGTKCFISQATLLAKAADLLPNDTLIIRLDLNNPDTMSVAFTKPYPMEMPNYDLLSLQRDEETCDLNIHVIGLGGPDGRKDDNDVVPAEVEVVKAHKLILSAFSKVFKAMFYGPMQEAQSNKLVIENFSVQAVQRMVDFLYSGKMHHQAFALSELLELLTLSCKYQVEVLTAKCATALINMLCEENAVEVLVVLHTLSLTEVRDVVMEFIVDHPKSTLHGVDLLKTCDKDLLLDIVLKTAANEETRDQKKRKLELI